MSHDKEFKLPFRPDHGLLMMEEINSNDVKPGYSLLGRMKGLSQLLGIVYSLEKVSISSPNDHLLLRKKIKNQQHRNVKNT